MNAIAAQEYIFSENGICNYCNGFIDERGFYIHENSCEGGDNNLYESELDENSDLHNNHMMNS